MPKKYTAYVVSHTHWDRAWYWPFEQFRIRLVETLDQLIELLKKDPEYKYFVFDGQTVVLDDYLEIKPQMREELERLVKAGRLLVGPWYVLPDEFIVSGESLVRNLMLGHKIAKEFGAVMKEGYVPDSFGHIDQLPQIFQGFDIGSFIFSRGMGEEVKDIGTEFWWESPDGSKVIAVYQWDNYGNFGALGFHEIWGDYRFTEPDLDLAFERAKKESSELMKHARTSNLLMNNGCDHLPPQPQLPRMLKHINEMMQDVHFQHGTFPQFVDALRKSGVEFKTYRGELLSNIHWVILLSVYSARMYLKQQNFKTQTLLERYAEPISAFASVEGKTDFSPFVWQAWKLLLQNHPHDDICGSSVDVVHQDNLSRFSHAQQVGSYVRHYAFEDFGACINTGDRNGKPLLLFNPLNWNRTDLVEAQILFPQGDKISKKFSIVDSAGANIPYQVVSRCPVSRMEILKEGKYDAVDVKLLGKDVPGCGYSTYYIVPSVKKRAGARVKAGRNFIENEFIRVRANSNGSLRILDKTTNKVYDSCNIFEDTEDAGDEYTYSYIANSKTFTTRNAKAKVLLVSKGLVSATLKIEIRSRIPISLRMDRKARDIKKIDCPITSYVTLSAAVKRVDIVTQIDNRAKDHRLRALFPSGLVTDRVYADGHFDVVERPAYYPKKPTEKNPFEYYATRNQQVFASVGDGSHWLTVANKGLPEYEILEENGKATIALTLLRCVGWLSRGDLITRPGHAGWFVEAPEAQCLGEHEFEYSVIPASGTWHKAKVYKPAYEFAWPIDHCNIGKQGGKLRDRGLLVGVEPDELVLSALKKSENGNNLVARFYNICDHYVNGRISAYRRIIKANLVNMNEEFIQELAVNDKNQIEMRVGRNEIITVELVLE
jgi:mannosylglycerate hydrolase